MINWKSLFGVTMSVLLVTVLPVAYKHFGVDDATGNQVIGFVIGVATSQGVMKIRKVRRAKKFEKELGPPI